MNEFDKLPQPMIECDYENCYYEFYYMSDLVAHKDIKHPISKNNILKRKGQRRLSDYWIVKILLALIIL